MATNDQFIREKLHNFCEFLKGCLQKRISNARYIEFANKLNELQAVDSAQFILHCTTEMSPYRNNKRAYIEKLLGENNVVGEFSKEELEKIERYIKMFIELVS